jgi:hypothetical protein
MLLAALTHPVLNHCMLLTNKSCNNNKRTPNNDIKSQNIQAPTYRHDCGVVRRNTSKLLIRRSSLQASQTVGLQLVVMAWLAVVEQVVPFRIHLSFVCAALGRGWLEQLQHSQATTR